MRREFLVERNGRTFCLYAGLLDLAHQHGLKSIRTDIVQVPNAGNNHVAICTAVVVLEKEGIERSFTGIADASPSNVAPAMKECLLRMSETRAKARALRDAVNVGVAAFEELGEEGAHDGAPERGYLVPAQRSLRQDRSATNGSRGINGNGKAMPLEKQEKGTPIPAEMRNPATSPSTEAQQDAIRSLCRRLNAVPEDVVKETFAVEGVNNLTQTQASELIKSLNERRNVRPAVVS